MTVQQLTVAIENIGNVGDGVFGVRKIKELKDFMTKANPEPNIIVLQEHHFSLEECMEKTHSLDFKGGTSIWNNALYLAKGAKFSAGTTIVVRKQLASCIIESKAIIEGRAQFALLQLGSRREGILNIYAPIYSATRGQV